MRILSVFGTRPEAIKMAPVVQELARRSEFESLVCVTAQHRQMLDQVLDIFGIRPDIDLDLMQPGQSLPDLTARIIIQMSQVLADVRPDAVLIQGDTTTVMATALAAYYEQIPIGHVEAGLRTGDPYSPFPEEMNRRLTGAIARWHFAPTETAANALRREGISDDRIHVTGNPVIDALLWTVQQPVPAETERLLSRVRDSCERIILVTAHRRESFGPLFEEICLGLRQVVRRNPDVAVIYPVHLNPNVQEPVHRWLDGEPRVYLTDPMSYLSFAHLMAASDLVLTDSGGIQEEAPALGKPVLVLRDVTERPEAVVAGTAKLVGPHADAIIAESERLLHDAAAYRAMANAISPYGDGRAAGRIVSALLAG